MTSKDGSSYDISILQTLGPLSGTDSENKWHYTVSICEDALTSCDICSEAGYCQKGKGNEDQDVTFCIGKYVGITGYDQGRGVELLYNEPVVGRVGKVIIHCNPGGPIVSNITVVSPSSITGYEFHFDSSAACGFSLCQVESFDGYTYDLSPFAEFGPIQGRDNRDIWTYTITVCTNGMTCGLCDNGGYCQKGFLGIFMEFCVGSQTAILGLPNGAGVELSYTESQEGRKGKIFIYCEDEGPIVSDVYAFTPVKITEYEFYFNSSVACPTNAEDFIRQ